MFLISNELRQVHLELTEKCNAACPLCIRTNPNGLKPRSYIGNNELLLTDIEQFFTDDIRSKLLEVHMCGSYGDPVMARDCLGVADYFSNGTCEVSISTNGSIRGMKWWQQLGNVLSRNPRSRVDFHIDGLADTNRFYRRNTRFEKIIENARAYIEGGGNANWEFIPFKHNEHQLEEARQLSISLGFSRFTVKKSNWLFGDDQSRISFIDEKGSEQFLEAPSDHYLPKRDRNRSAVILGEVSNNDIQCLAQRCHELYVSCEGIVYPCCWTARHARNIYLGRTTKDGFSQLFKRYNGRTQFDIRKFSLEEMVKSDFFIALEHLWRQNKPAVCFKKCGCKNQPEKVKLDNYHSAAASS